MSCLVELLITNDTDYVSGYCSHFNDQLQSAGLPAYHYPVGRKIKHSEDFAYYQGAMRGLDFLQDLSGRLLSHSSHSGTSSTHTCETLNGRDLSHYTQSAAGCALVWNLAYYTHIPIAFSAERFPNQCFGSSFELKYALELAAAMLGINLKDYLSGDQDYYKEPYGRVLSTELGYDFAAFLDLYKMTLASIHYHLIIQSSG